MSTDNASDAPRHFIQQIIDADLESGRHSQVVTRFPPEPNGYLHIGHAKSICLNFGLAAEYGGRCHLRFDDTNPTKEDTEYVDSIQADVRWLGFDWGEHLYFASDYFERLYELAELLIREGNAYVCSLSEEEIRAYRGTLSEAGRPSPYRERTVEENLDLFRRMRAGEFEDGAHVLRARIDMANPNMKMRDPLMYRIRHAHHHRTGDAWCLYPMYDWTHGLSDSFEGISHSICTLEFENNRELYDWFIEATHVPCQPRQYEFARLNIEYTTLSKRKLLKLVESGVVDGWDDPRMPTIAGMRRRGITAESLRAFASLVGVAKANSVVDLDKLTYCIRDDLNQRAPRVMAVLSPLKVVITNFPEGEVDWLEASLWPHDVPKEGTRRVPFTRELLIEREDFAAKAPKRWKRLAPGWEVRLRYAYFIRCDEVVTDPDSGEVVELRCSYDPATRGGDAPDGRKPKGTLHWVSATESLPATVRLFEQLFASKTPDVVPPGADFTVNLSPDSRVELTGARVEPSVASDDPETRYQFERQGYFWRDPVDSAADALVFNRIVGLRDSWAKATTAEAPKPTPAPAPADPASKAPDAASADGERQRPAKRSKSYERTKAREVDAELAARYARYQDELELSSDDADVLAGDRGLSDFFEAALAAHDGVRTVANVLLNGVLRFVDDGDLSQLAFGPDGVAELAALMDADTISSSAAREVLDEMATSGAAPRAIVTARGLEQVDDADAIAAAVDGVLRDHPDEVQRYRSGDKRLLGFFIGAAVRATGGSANPKLVQQVVRTRLG